MKVSYKLTYLISFS